MIEDRKRSVNALESFGIVAMGGGEFHGEVVAGLGIFNPVHGTHSPLSDVSEYAVLADSEVTFGCMGRVCHQRASSRRVVGCAMVAQSYAPPNWCGSRF